MIIIVDYGLGNIRSIEYKLRKNNFDCKVSSDPIIIQNAKKLILPGVGHFGKGMQNLKDNDLIPVLNYLVLNKKVDILGICLGMQLFFEFSEEGETNGLGWIKGKVKKFSFSENNLPIPHVGWNLCLKNKESIFFEEWNSNKRYYFTHSFFASCEDDKDILGLTDYGGKFCSAVEKGNIVGTQFHPEKSGLRGFDLINQFLSIA